MERNNQTLDKKIILYCTNFIYVALITIPFVASFSSALVNIFIGFSIFAFLVKKIIKREFLRFKTVITFPFLFLIFFSLISFINSANLKASLEGISKLLKYGFLFIIITEELTDRNHLKKIIIATFCGLYLASLDAAFQLYFGKDFFRHKAYDFVINLPRLKAAFPHTNIFATYLALLVPICVCLFLYYLKGRKKLLLGLMSGLMIYCLVFTFSRGAIFGFAIAVLFMGLLRKDKLILILLLIVLITTPFILPQNIKDWIKTTDSAWEVMLNKERIYIYKTSLNMIKAHPFIGVGANTYCLNYLQYRPQDPYGYTGESSYYAHNIFLHMAAEIGLLGLGVFLWLLFSFFKRWFNFFSAADNSLLKICSLGIIAGIVAFLINGLTETNLYYSKVATLFWYQIGLCLGIFNLNKEKIYE